MLVDNPGFASNSFFFQFFLKNDIEIIGYDGSELCEHILIY